MSLTPATIKGFAGSLLAQRYDDPVPTPDVHLEWWEMCCSNYRLVAIAAPRYHAKSTAITHAYLLAELLFRESDYALIISDTCDQATKFLGDITADLEDNEDIREFFKIDGFEKDNESEIIVRFIDGKKFKVEAKGAGQKVRGTKWNQKRPNLIIIDDLENDENVQTKEQRSKLKHWVNKALIPCMSRRGKLRAVGTIIHADSWLASTMPNESSIDTVNTQLKVYSKHPNSGWYSAKYRGHPAIGDYSILLWPGYRTEQFFRDEYSRLEKEGCTDDYSSEQLNEPLDETYAYFKKTDFIDIPTEKRKLLEMGELPLTYYGSADFAISTKEKADYTAMGIVGIDDEGQMYLLHISRERYDPNSSVEELFILDKKYEVQEFFVEKGTLARAIGAMLETEQKKRHKYINFTPINTPGDKRMTARSIQKIMRGGGLYIDKQTEWYSIFEDELLRFDRGRYDDQVDMIALIGLKADELINAPTSEELEEMEYEEIFGDTSKMGKNKYGGY